MLIGIGNVIYLTLENHYIGAMLFSFALLTIINNNLPLYTGKIGFISEYDKMDFVKMLFGNLIGVTIIMFIAILCKDNLYEVMVANAEMKFFKQHSIYILARLFMRSANVYCSVF